MKRYISFYFLLLNTFSYAQSRNINWCFGDSAGINFNTGTPVPFSTSMDSRGSCTSISDSLGNLLFYTTAPDRDLYLEGYSKLTCVYNRNHVIMQGGDSLIGNLWYQENLIIPKPKNDSLYYLFHIGVTHDYGLYYSVIDISQDSGLGSVIEKNIQLRSEKAIDGINAIKHGNGRDWWLVFRDWQTFNNNYYVYLITPDSIALNAIQSVGDTNKTNASLIQFNQKGDQILLVNVKGLIELFDFDRCTGLITLNKIIEHETIDYPYYFGCEFSPNGRFVYIVSEDYNNTLTDSSHLYQFDLNATDVPSSKTNIYSFELPESPGELKLAPDGKIYLSSNDIFAGYPYSDSVRNYINENLSVINKPDSLGTACNFTSFSFYLGGKRTYVGLPNNPNYDLGPDSGSICDSLGLGVEILEHISQDNVVIFPNPFSNKISFYPLQSASEKISIAVFNNIGETVFEEETMLRDQEIDLTKLTKGVYFLNVKNEKISVTKKIVKL